MKMNSSLVPASLGWLLACAPGMHLYAQSANPETRDSELQSLFNTPVVSASRSTEKLLEAPATVIVLRREDLESRGYSELSQILDDLPGMQLARAYGDSMVKNYWRGFRQFAGDPYLLLMDGRVMNDLFYNNAETALVALPLSNVRRIEVVYGPASVIYGPNAFMGVINVITDSGSPDLPPSQTGRFWSGSLGQRGVDASSLARVGEVAISVAARFENSHVDDHTSERYEFSRNHYRTDPSLWGGFLSNSRLAGPFHSENHARSLDLRAKVGATELGVQYLNLQTGYGNEYAADLASNSGIWGRRLLAFHLQSEADLTPRLKVTTNLRYRETDITPDSYFVDGYYDTSQKMRLAAYSWYQVENSSVMGTLDFSYQSRADFDAQFGLKYEQKDLDKAGDVLYGPYLPVAQINVSTYPFPAPASPVRKGRDRLNTEDQGVYLQFKWRLNPQHLVILGGRRDANSSYGAATTLRGGYVGQHGVWTFKALFGQAYQEPTPRVLYGSWATGSPDPNLRPEQSSTTEISLSYGGRASNVLLSAWQTENKDTFITAFPQALNLGKSQIRGLDLHVQAIPELPAPWKLKLWAYASCLLRWEGTNPAHISGGNALEGLTVGGRVGDLARLQGSAGATLDFPKHLSCTLQARYVGSRVTVATNPVGAVDGYVLLDATLTWRNPLGVPGLDLRVQGRNLTDKLYFHPGLSQANAGTTPGYWDTGGAWHGSGGYYNSLLAQPGRSLQVSLGYTF